ncbi:hypothetical protein M1D52_19720 [Olivibacter sp. SA151]|uniref:YtkA-like domain-containing protein n=1 Tax=Sphingobacterium sp. (strain 21) TaxID=743722 RepID=F4CCY0_SPHS2
MKAITITGFSVILSFFLFAACNNSKTTDQTNETDAADIDKSTTSVAPLEDNRDSINLQLINGEAAQEARMEKGKHVVFSFNVKNLGKLSASVKPGEPNGNVRIAQIFLPNNVADGPFGPTMEYNIKEPGVYRIVVSENQMAGEPYNGPFTFSLKITPR